MFHNLCRIAWSSSVHITFSQCQRQVHLTVILNVYLVYSEVNQMSQMSHSHGDEQSGSQTTDVKALKPEINNKRH